MEAKTVACDLALLLDRLFSEDDASRDVAAVQALGRAAGVVIRRVALWGADDVRKVLSLRTMLSGPQDWSFGGGILR